MTWQLDHYGVGTDSVLILLYQPVLAQLSLPRIQDLASVRAVKFISDKSVSQLT